MEARGTATPWPAPVTKGPEAPRCARLPWGQHTSRVQQIRVLRLSFREDGVEKPQGSWRGLTSPCQHQVTSNTLGRRGA